MANLQISFLVMLVKAIARLQDEAVVTFLQGNLLFFQKE
jgi:hypothetical protein